jgi:thiosulfate/3-mercaptopyruvate sulfurtransferase
VTEPPKASAFGPLVTTEWLAANAHDPGLCIVDVRWYLDPSMRGRDAYARGHIPGAIFLDVDRDLSGPGGRRGGPLGRHPWPSVSQIEQVMGEAGIDVGVRVVAYDDAGGSIAARLWHLLRSFGHGAVAVLDGGIVKWAAEARPLTTAVPSIEPRRFVARRRADATLTKDEMIARDPETLVIDARAPERYRGEVEPIDLRAGHIPGAVSVPVANNLTTAPVPVFRSPAELRSLYGALGAERRPTVAYCGSGITSCHTLLALELAGLSGRLYAGSWSEWSADPARPVATVET